MQIKVFSVPVVGGESANEEMNAFLRGHKILQVEQQLVSGPADTYWSFCIRYIQGGALAGKRGKRSRKDYKSELPPEVFERFSILRKIRKQIAEEDSVPAFAVFTDKQLSALSKMEELSDAAMQSVAGVGDKKVGKYAERFRKSLSDEKGK
ncbi:MAG: HRDC domain-containing protein [Phaeodactylibacter sp.]|uniref:HRDC domain-containing protein n=1 Tax=Phaeodactylibacter sp. TaxID=1940289 RepID=UPI0032F039B4